MPLILTWRDVLLRLFLTLIAGILIGLDREERGRTAGLCTTTLVALAASVAMIQTNWLMITTGKTPNSFGVLDLMRLPLGILSGMGFIGGGVIIRRETTVRGVTTAATLWFITVIGLCLGGGQLALGMTALGLGLFVLWGLKAVERLLKQQRTALLTITAGAGAPAEEELLRPLLEHGYKTQAAGASYVEGAQRTFSYEIKWRSRRRESSPPPFLATLAGRPGILALEWKPQS